MTSWTDGAQSNFLTAQFCIDSLISPVSRTKRVMQNWCVIPASPRENQPASQPVGNHQTEGLIVSDLLEGGRTEVNVGHPDSSSPSLHPCSVRAFVF